MQVIDKPPAGGSKRFLHIYGPIPVDAVAEVIPFPCDAEGRFPLPAALEA